MKFLWASEEINKNPEPYWRLVMDIAMRNTLNRIIKYFFCWFLGYFC